MVVVLRGFVFKKYNHSVSVKWPTLSAYPSPSLPLSSSILVCENGWKKLYDLRLKTIKGDRYGGKEVLVAYDTRVRLPPLESSVCIIAAKVSQKVYSVSHTVCPSLLSPRYLFLVHKNLQLSRSRAWRECPRKMKANAKNLPHATCT